MAQDAGTDPGVLTPDTLVRRRVRAERIIRERASRARFLPRQVLCEPGFDMLLDLYVARCSDADVSVSSLGLAGQVPATTALRRIEELQRLGLVVRQPDPLDRRRVFVRMSDRAFADIGRWLDQIG